MLDVMREREAGVGSWYLIDKQVLLNFSWLLLHEGEVKPNAIQHVNELMLHVVFCFFSYSLLDPKS